MSNELPKLHFNSAILMKHRSPGGFTIWVSVSVDQDSITIRPRGIHRLVALLNGLRGETSFDRRDVTELIDTNTTTNGGLWFRLGEEQYVRLSFVRQHVDSLSKMVGLKVQTPDNRAAAERELRKKMRTGLPFDW